MTPKPVSREPGSIPSTRTADSLTALGERTAMELAPGLYCRQELARRIDVGCHGLHRRYDTAIAATEHR